MKQNYKIDKLLLELSSDGGGSSTPVVVEGDTLYPKSLKVSKKKKEYNQDDVLDLDDLTVECTYTDGSSAVIKHYTTNVDEIDMGYAGYKSLKVTYCHNGITVSNSIGIIVKNTDSYNNIQLAYKIAKSGLLNSGIAIVTCRDKLIQYGKFKIRIKAKFVIEQNENNSYTTIGFGDYNIWGNNTIGKTILLAPKQLGEFKIDTVIDTYTYNHSTTNANAEVLKLYQNGGNKLQGYFELKDVSITYIEPVAKIPVSLSASKVQTRAVIGEDLITDDITATVKYNTDATAVVTPIIKLPEELTVGDNKITVEYSEKDKTVSTTINIRYYKADKTEPDEFHDLTAREWCEAWHLGINWGNSLDSKAIDQKNYKNSYKGDSYMNQETAWGQPAATLQNFLDIKEKGFDMVRIPITWCYNSYIEPELTEDGLTKRHIGKFWACRAAEVVDLALEAGLYVLINMHHEQPILYTASSASNMKQVYKDAEDCWTEIAEKFKHYNERLAFEGYNEVDNLKSSFNFGEEAAEQMNKLNQIFVDCVRKSGSNNAKRVLHCPTTVHIDNDLAYKAWVYPKDTIENHIVCNTHNYDGSFVQDADKRFTAAEKWSIKYNVPICLGEWGTNTKNGDYDFRARHAQNFIARAKYHHLYPVFWDNGSDYELVKKYNRIHEYNHPFEELQKIIDGIHKGYEEMKAFALPKDMVLTFNTPEDFHYDKWDTASQSYKWSGWGYASTDMIPVYPKKKYIISANRFGGMATERYVQLQTIAFFKQVTLDNGEKEYKAIYSSNEAYHTFTKKGVVPDDAEFCLITMTTAKENTKAEEFQSMLNNGELSLDFIQYEDSDIFETQLEYRKPTTISVEKAQTSYLELNSELNVDDMTITCNYNDGFTRVLSAEDYIVDTSKVDMSKKGQYYLNISTTIDGVELTAQIEILVGALLAEISANPTELVSKVGNTSIDTSSITVTAKYADDSTSVLEAGTYTIDASAIKLDEVGTYDIVITYTELNIERICTVTCEVYDKLECKGFTRNEKSDYEPYALDGQLDPVFNGEEPNACQIWNIMQYKNDRYATTAPEIYIDVLDITKVVNEYHVFIPKKYITKRYASWEIKNIFQAKNAIALGSSANEGQSITAETITDSLNREWIKLSFKPPVDKDFTAVNKRVMIGKPTMPVYVTSEADLGTIEIAEDAPTEEENIETTN